MSCAQLAARVFSSLSGDYAIISPAACQHVHGIRWQQALTPKLTSLAPQDSQYLVFAPHRLGRGDLHFVSSYGQIVPCLLLGRLYRRQAHREKLLPEVWKSLLTMSATSGLCNKRALQSLVVDSAASQQGRSKSQVGSPATEICVSLASDPRSCRANRASSGVRNPQHARNADTYN